MVIFHSYVSLPEGIWYAAPVLTIQMAPMCRWGAAFFAGQLRHQYSDLRPGSGAVWWWACEHAALYAFTCTHIYISYIYIYLYTYIYTYIYLCNLYLYLSIYIYISISIYLYIYIYIHILIYIYICIYIIYRVFTFPPEADEISFTMEDEDPFFFRHDSLLLYRHEAWEDWESCWGFP